MFPANVASLPDLPRRQFTEVHDAAAKLGFRPRKHDHRQPLLETLHWLPVQTEQIIEKIQQCQCQLSVRVIFFCDSSPAYNTVIVITELLVISYFYI